jgi:multicomponent Na+:H+ antiporter subunit D
MPEILIIMPLVVLFIINLPVMKFLQRASWWLVIMLTLVQIFFMGWSLFGAKPVFDFQITLLTLNLNLDSFGQLTAMTSAIISFSAMMVARGIFKDIRSRHLFSSLLLVVMTGLNGLVMLNDVFSLYVFLEVTSVASFILIAFNNEADGLEGSFKYLILSAVATAMILSAIAFFMLISGDTSFSSIHNAIESSSKGFYVKLAMAMYVCGLLIKSGVFPFHWWLPDAYGSAPAPVSVLLAGIVTKVSGIYTLIRIITSAIVWDAALSHVLIGVGIVSIIAGALLAAKQNNMKRMLAYSSVSQMGYIITGLGCGTPLGIAAAVFHFFNHAIFKSLLFTDAAAIESKAGTIDMNRLGGITARMPITGTTSLVGFFSAAGIPPFAGFFSKFFIVLALWESGFYAVAVVALLASLLTVYYFLVLQRRVFFGMLRSGFEGLKDAGFTIVFPELLLAAISLAAGIMFKPLFESVFMLIGTSLMR